MKFKQHIKEIIESTLNLSEENKSEDLKAAIIASDILDEGAKRLKIPTLTNDFKMTEYVSSSIYFERATQVPKGFETLFKTICIEAKVAKLKDNNWWVKYGWKYEHPGGGRNGNSIGSAFFDENFKFISAREERF